ncbi:MAG: hypothetical protein ABGY96_13625 [bacterium]
MGKETITIVTENLNRRISYDSNVDQVIAVKVGDKYFLYFLGGARTHLPFRTNGAARELAPPVLIKENINHNPLPVIIYDHEVEIAIIVDITDNNFLWSPVFFVVKAVY